MKFQSHLSQADSRWQRYKRLELLPDSVSNSSKANAPFIFGLNWAWKTLISLLVAELVAEDRVGEYLDRCWARNISDDQKSSNNLKQLWVLMD
uniref:Uncharacterized protein n=1 Tax=Oscillatoriales cyanobacterium SpSt-402 TaxID=2282168 RepID=A0A832GZ31_9CYAN